MVGNLLTGLVKLEQCIKCYILVTIAGIQEMMSHAKMITCGEKLEAVLRLLTHVGLAIGKKARKRGMLMQNGYWNTQTKCVLEYLIPTRTDDLSFIVL